MFVQLLKVVVFGDREKIVKCHIQETSLFCYIFVKTRLLCKLSYAIERYHCIFSLTVCFSCADCVYF